MKYHLAKKVEEIWGDLGRYARAPKTHPADGFERPGVHPVFFENGPYGSKETRVFAWIGLPYLKPGETCPAMVLLHGGGGTAFDEWVRIWNRRGYAAITFDQCGCLPELPEASGGIPHERHEFGGPPGWDFSFHHVDDALEDQWQYHAVGAALRAHSLLAAMPEVDSDRIGVTGISWGGYLTCLVAAADPRLKCAIPVYGCGYLGENSAWNETVFPTMDPGTVDRWLNLWDPAEYIPQAAVPFCWVSGTNDLAYPLDSLVRSYKLTGDSRTTCIRLEMPHSHPDGWAPEEIGVFADSLLRSGPPLLRITEAGIDNGVFLTAYTSTRPVMRAELLYTRAEGNWSDRKFRVADAEIDERSGFAKAAVPPHTTACFMNLHDDRKCVVSSDLVNTK